MSCCFTQLGRVPHNAPIELGIQAAKVGVYSFGLRFLGATVYQTQTIAEVGDELIIPGPFNEDYTYELTVTDPDGEVVVNEANGDCDTWVFTTFMSINQQCHGTNECDADESDPTDYPS
jgi:hypothetical protein